MSAHYGAECTFDQAANPALNQIDWQHVHELRKLKLAVVCVENRPCEALFKQTRYADEVGIGLSRVNLGRHVGSLWHPFILHFFHVPANRIPDALRFVYGAVKERGMPAARVSVADPAMRVWRDYVPPVETDEEEPCATVAQPNPATVAGLEIRAEHN